MKKVLLTSTALVAFAGAAAAEVTMSGSAEMGVIGGENIETQFLQSIDVRFSLSGETDNGLTFGGSIDLDDVADSATSSPSGLGDQTGFADFTVFVSGEFGTVTMGDTDGALDWAMTDAASIGNPGSIADNETGHLGRQDTYFDGAYDGQILRYDYAYEGFGFAVSVEQDDRSDAELDQDAIDAGLAAGDLDRGDYNWAVGVKWSGEAGPGTVKVGAGYQATDYASLTLGTDDNNITLNFNTDATVWGLSAGYYMDNGFSIGGTYSDWSADGIDDGSHWAIGAGYAFDAFSVHANYGEHYFKTDGSDKIDASGWGLAAGYDLGGGLSVLAGYGYSELEIKDGATGDKSKGDTSNWSLGLSMSF
ncbi:porin [Aliiruegeria sabulilitoris]|uniref:porin n=1 Tax=Aliiruegeria sabulilitoris TaxID=1510458 RepID=UPI00083503FE|nr:porin [Aliiruegeria sabulilitoris]NDR58577.1 porin [Pseudoruegeria sp. M32A2M]